MKDLKVALVILAIIGVIMVGIQSLDMAYRQGSGQMASMEKLQRGHAQVDGDQNNKLISIEIVDNEGRAYEGHAWIFGIYNTGTVTERGAAKTVKLVYWNDFQNEVVFRALNYNDVALIADGKGYVEVLGLTKLSYIVHTKERKENE